MDGAELRTVVTEDIYDGETSIHTIRGKRAFSNFLLNKVIHRILIFVLRE